MTAAGRRRRCRFIAIRLAFLVPVFRKESRDVHRWQPRLECGMTAVTAPPSPRGMPALIDTSAALLGMLWVAQSEAELTMGRKVIIIHPPYHEPHILTKKIYRVVRE